MDDPTVEIPTKRRLEEIRDAFVLELSSLTETNSDGNVHSRVCLFCDRNVPLEKENCYVLPFDVKRIVTKIAALTKPLPNDSAGETGSIYPKALLDQYGVQHSQVASLSLALLSPRSVETEKGYVTCYECHQCVTKEKPQNPPYSIAKGYIIGKAPPELTRLNEFELAVVSLVRNVANIFTFFAGCHKAISGWHTFYQANLGHSMSTLDRLDEFKVRNIVTVALCGPFTTEQKALVMTKMSLNREHCIQAFTWLKANNALYKNVKVPRLQDIPDPVVMDES
jgi:hypothetical protein